MGKSILENTVPKLCMIIADTLHALAPSISTELNASLIALPSLILYLPVVLVLLSILGSFLCFYPLLGNNRKLSHNTLALGLIPNVLAPIEAPID